MRGPRPRILIDGKTLRQHARERGVSYDALWTRLKRHGDLEERPPGMKPVNTVRDASIRAAAMMGVPARTLARACGTSRAFVYQLLARAS